jgi:hypothetical protein
VTCSSYRRRSRSQRQARRTAQHLDGSGAITAATVTRVLSSKPPFTTSARGAYIAYVAYPAYPAYVDFGMPMQLRHNRKTGCPRLLHENVAIL